MNVDPDLPFFTRDGDFLHPSDATRGPWTPNSLHGRVIIGLLGAEIERMHGAPEYHPARLTVEMYRAPPLVPLEVRTRLLRDGHRIKVVEAEILADGQSAARATCQLLRRTDAPEGKVWKGGGEWQGPMPDELESVGVSPMSMNGMWDLRLATGSLGRPGQRRVWMRETRPLVAGEALTPFGRVVVSADFVSPLANMGDKSLEYINSDLTLYLHRAPVGEWIGYESLAHEASAGIAIGHCAIHDSAGRIGWGSICALAQTISAAKTPPG